MNVSPQYVSDSTIVTITGTGFSDTIANDKVFLNGKQLTILSAKDTIMTAMVPTLAGSGYLNVTADGNTVAGPPLFYDTSFRISVISGGLTAGHYLASDSDGNLYVPTNDGNGTIYKITAAGVMSTLASSVNASDGAALDASGNLYVVSNVNYLSPTIFKVSPAGVVSPFATDAGYLYGLAVDGSGNVYTANSTDSSIDKFTPQGVMSVFASGLPGVSGLAFGKDGSLYATITTNSTSLTAGAVVMISSSGVQTTVATGLQFCGEDGIVVDPNNVIYVTCFNQAAPTSYVNRIEPGGSGPGTSIYSDNSYIPLGIIMDKTGNLYVLNNSARSGNPAGNLMKLTMH